MFTRVAANTYRHSDGYEVRIVDRDTLTYKDALLEAVVGVELPPERAIIYTSSLEVSKVGAERIECNDADRELILSRMAAALRTFLRVELA